MSSSKIFTNHFAARKMCTFTKFPEYVKSWGCKTITDDQYSEQPDELQM